MQGAPIMILNPKVSGALYFTGGGSLTIVGGPPRSIVVNSSSSTAVQCGSSGVIDTRKGGPNLTGSDVGTYGGPSTAPGPSTGCYGTNGNTGLTAGFNGGTNGKWAWPASPIARSLWGGSSRYRNEERHSGDESHSQQRHAILQSRGSGHGWMSGQQSQQLWQLQRQHVLDLQPQQVRQQVVVLPRLQGIRAGILPERHLGERRRR